MTVAVNVPSSPTLAVAATAPPASIETVLPSGSAARPDSAYGLPAAAGSFAALEQHAVDGDVAAHRRMQLAVVGDGPGRVEAVLERAAHQQPRRGEAAVVGVDVVGAQESLCQVTVSPASTSTCGTANDAL